MNRSRVRIIISGVICIGVFGISVYIWAHSSDSRFLQVYILDIGQGDAIYVRSPSGKDMLVDAGPSPAILRRLAEVMPWSDRKIDFLVETHPDQDHIGGMPDVLDRYRVGEFVSPGIDSLNSIDDEIARIIADENIASTTARRGMKFDLGDGVYFQILFPDRDPVGMTTNEASIVGKVVYGSTSILLTGDSPKSVESMLVKLDGSALKSDILKVGHHGSKTSSSDLFVATVDPDVAVISVGEGNRYHHPSPETLAVFERRGIPVARTDIEGTIGFVSDGTSFHRK